MGKHKRPRRDTYQALIGAPDLPGALCAGSPTDLWYPDSGNYQNARSVRQARGVCNLCPVQQACAEWAIENEPFGIWGGLTEKQRADMKAARRRRFGESLPTTA